MHSSTNISSSLLKPNNFLTVNFSYVTIYLFGFMPKYFPVIDMFKTQLLVYLL